MKASGAFSKPESKTNVRLVITAGWISIVQTKRRHTMNRPMSWNALLQQVATASVVSKPVMKKKAATDAIYGAAEPKRKVQPKRNLTDAELQEIWDRNKAKMRSQTATALAQMQQRSPSPQRIPATPIGRPRMQVPGILSTAPQAQSNPMWKVK